MSYSKFDLTFKIGQYLDRHLVFPLLEFLAAKEVGYKFQPDSLKTSLSTYVSV